jgi:hypothetical protein
MTTARPHICGVPSHIRIHRYSRAQGGAGGFACRPSRLVGRLFPDPKKLSQVTLELLKLVPFTCAHDPGTNPTGV